MIGETAVQTIRMFLHNQATFREFLDAIRDIEYCYVHPEVKNCTYALRLWTHNKSSEDPSYALDCVNRMEKHIVKSSTKSYTLLPCLESYPS